MNNRDEMVKRILVAGVLLLVAVGMSVASWIILPEYVVTQFKGLQTGAMALPKLWAVLIAFAFSAGFAVVSVREEQAVKYAFIGYGLHILYWICNV